MSDSGNNLNSNVGMDTTGFKAGVAQLTAQIKSIETGFRASAAVMDNWSGTSNGLKERISSLSDKLGLQKQALNTLHAEYDKVVASEGAGSKAVESLAKQMYDMQQKISGTNKSLEKYDSQLKTVTKQEKEANSPLSKMKTGFSQLAEQSKKSTSGIGSAFGSLKSTVAGFATTFIAGISLKEVVDETDSAEKSMAQMEAVLKSTKDASGMTKEQLEELAEAQSKVTTFSKNTTESAENLLLTFTNIGKNVFPQATSTVLDMSQALGQDTKTSAIQLGKALNNPIKGVTALQRVGVTFNDAQKKQIATMMKAGDVAGAQSIILKELQKEFGGSAKAAGQTFTGQIQIMKNNLKDSGVAIMTSLMPIVMKLMPSVVKGAQSLADAITAHKSEIVGAVTTAANVIKGVFDFVATHGALVKGIVIGIGSAFLAFKAVSGIIAGVTTAMKIWQGVTKAFTVVQAALNLVMSMNPIGLVVIAIAAVIAILVVLFNKCKPFHDWVINAGKDILNFFKGVPAFFSNLGGRIVSFFKQWGPAALAVLVPFIGIPLLIFQHFSQIKSWLAGIWNNAIGGIKGFVGSAGRAVGAIGGVIRNGFSGAISFIKGLPGEALQWGKDIIGGIVNGIKSAIGAVGNAVKGVAQNIRNFLHFSKPDTGPLADFDTYMPDMMGTMAKGITGNIGKLKSAAKGAAAAISGGLNVSANLSPAYAGISAAAPAAKQSSPSVTRNANTVININNPVAEKSSDSVRKQMTRLSYMGVLS